MVMVMMMLRDVQSVEQLASEEVWKLYMDDLRKKSDISRLMCT